MTHIVRNSYTRFIAGKGPIEFKPGDKIKPSPDELAAFGSNFRAIHVPDPDDENEPSDDETGEGGENNQPPTPAQVRAMNKGSLEELAAKLGVDISGAKNNPERAELIIAAMEGGASDESETDPDDENEPSDDETGEGGADGQPQDPGAGGET